MRTIAVFFGGKSNEREISVITGVYAVNLLRGAGYRVLPIYITEENAMMFNESLKSVDDFRLQVGRPWTPVRFVKGGICYEKKPKKQIPIACALNCCHGGVGEGGVLSALLEWFGIVSASPCMTESAVFLDKTISKIALQGLGVPVVPFLVLKEADWQRDGDEATAQVAEKLDYPVIVKPSKLGSSVGISVARDEEELKKALTLCFRIDSSALIEKYLQGKRDLNCAAYRLGGKIVLSPIEEVFSGEPILTFGEKYEGGGKRTSKLPAEISEGAEIYIKKYLRCVYERFGMCGVVRADFLLCGEELYFNELNTVPGTLATYLFGESILRARELLKSLIEDAVSRGLVRKQILTSGILERHSYGGKSAKRY